MYFEFNSVIKKIQIIGCYITYQWKTGTYIYIFEDYYLLVNNVLSTLFLFYLIKSFFKCAYFDTRCMRADVIRYSAPVSTVFSYYIFSDFMTILKLLMIINTLNFRNKSI